MQRKTPVKGTKQVGLRDFIAAGRKQRGPRVLLADIETFPIEGYVWNLWKQNIGLDQIKQDWTLMSFAAKWLGQPEVYYDDVSEKRDVRDDDSLLRDVHRLLSNVDILVAHNGQRFDLPKLKARMAIRRLSPLPPIKVLDTLLLNRRAFGFTSQRLAYVSDQFAEQAKDYHKNFPGFKLWRECLAGNRKAWQECREYNIIDVTSMEETYKALRGWYEGAPNFGPYISPSKDGAVVCPTCGSEHVERRGSRETQVGIYARFHCLDCGGWSRGRYQAVSRKLREHILTN